MSLQISVFFDTNILEARHEEGKLKLSSIRLSHEFYEVIRFIKDKALESQVDICIPEIVWLELREHMRAQFCSDYRSLGDRVLTYRKSFGDLCDLNYTFGKNTIENYPDYVNQLEREFFEGLDPKVIVASYPRNSVVLEYLVERAVRKEKPFFQANNGKKYIMMRDLKTL